MINHFNGVSLRVKGVGTLKTKLYSLDETNSQDLKDLTLAVSGDRTKTLLANFSHERASLDLRVITIDHKFTINRIQIFVKPIATGYPQ